MNDVRLDPQQVPARAELLLAAEFGEDAPGRPIYGRLEPDDDGEPTTARIKVGAVLTRRLHAAEATETPAGAAYGNPLRGRPERAPSVPVGSALLARTDALDAHGWRVYRVTQLAVRQRRHVTHLHDRPRMTNRCTQRRAPDGRHGGTIHCRSHSGRTGRRCGRTPH